MEPTDELELLLKEAEKRGVTPAMLDDEVANTLSRQIAKVGDPTEQRRLEEEAAWRVSEINEDGIEAQLSYLLEHHEYRWLHELLLDLH
jgi:hypothetical protein